MIMSMWNEDERQFHWSTGVEVSTGSEVVSTDSAGLKFWPVISL